MKYCSELEIVVTNIENDNTFLLTYQVAIYAYLQMGFYLKEYLNDISVQFEMKNIL